LSPSRAGRHEVDMKFFSRYFFIGFLGVLLIFAVFNLLAAHLRSDCGLQAVLGMSSCADDIRRAGFPFLVWEEGGFAFRSLFYPLWLAIDVVIALGASLGIGLLTHRRFRKPKKE